MFSEVEMLRHVAVLGEKVDRNGLVPHRYIMTRLLENLMTEKASKDDGYFLTVTSLKSIDRIEIWDESKYGDMFFFHVAFKCRTFIPVKGEVLQGVVYRSFRNGVFLQCGPAKYAFLSVLKMPNYHYVSDENPVFLNDELAKIENDVVVRFVVLDVRWIEKRDYLKKEFMILASIDGESLGPVSLPGADEIDL